MTPQDAIYILRVGNEWRRGEELEQPDPRILGEAIDFAIRYMEDRVKQKQHLVDIMEADEKDGLYNHNAKEPPPLKGTTDIAEAVIKDIKERKKIGMEKYGSPLQAHNGRRALVDLYQELLDAVQYLKQELIERG